MILALFLFSMASCTFSFAQSYNSGISEREKNNCLFMIHAVSKIFISRPESTTDDGIQKHFARNYNAIKELRDYATVQDYNPEIIDFLNSNLDFYAKCYNLITEIINLKNKDYSEEIQKGAANASMNAGYNIGQATAINGGTAEQAMALSMLAGPFAAAAGAENARNEIISRINARSQENLKIMTRAIRQAAQNNMSKINLIRRKMNWPMYYGGAMTYYPLLTDNPDGTYPLDGSDLAQYWNVQLKTNPFLRAEVLKKCLCDMPSKEYADEQIQICLDMIPSGSAFNSFRQEIRSSLVYNVNDFSRPGMKVFFNNDGRISERQSQDGKGNIVPNPNSSEGDIVKYKYFDDNSSQVIETFRFINKENHLHTRISTNDANGYTIKVIHKNEKGEFLKLNGNVVGWTIINDKNGNPISMKFIDKDENYCPDQFGVWEKKAKYNSSGQVIRVTFHDNNSSICVNDKYVAGFDIEYDNEGNQKTYELDKKLNRIPLCVLVTEVLPNSEADRVGIKVGDIIVKYNNVTVSSTNGFIKLVESTELLNMEDPFESNNEANSEKLSIIINRKGTTKEYKVKPGKIGVRIGNEPLPPEMR